MEAFIGVTGCQFFLQLSFLIVILWLGERGKGLLDGKLGSLERLSVVNGCSDELTYVPFGELNATFDEAQSKQNGIVIMTIVMLGALGLECLCCCTSVCCKARRRM